MLRYFYTLLGNIHNNIPLSSINGLPHMNRDMTKPTKSMYGQASAQSVQSSLCAQWIAKDPLFLHAESKDSDQTGRMPRLIWVFAGRTLILLVLSCRDSHVFCRFRLNENTWYTKLTWSVNLPFCLIGPPEFYHAKNGTDLESPKINVCIANYIHLVAPFWSLVPGMTLITLCYTGMQATSHNRL